MIVCHKYRFIFLKTWKTGGTSIELALRSVCGPDDIITPVTEDRRDAVSHLPRNYLHDRSEWRWVDRLAWMFGGDAALKRFPAIGYFGHVGGVEARKRLPPEVWRDYFKFSVERNPWDRQVSQYFWTTRRQGDRRPAFKTYLRNAPLMRNWTIYTENDRPLVDYVMRYDDLERDLAAVVQARGAPDLAPMARAKGTFRADKGSYRDFYDEETRTLIAQRHAREIACFGWQF